MLMMRTPPLAGKIADAGVEMSDALSRLSLEKLLADHGLRARTASRQRESTTPLKPSNFQAKIITMGPLSARGSLSVRSNMPLDLRLIARLAFSFSRSSLFENLQARIDAGASATG